MDFWTIFGVVGVGATYAVAGGMLSLFLIGSWRRRGKGIVMDLAFAGMLVALPFVLGFTDTEKTAVVAGWAVGGAAALVYGLVVLGPDEDEHGGEETA